MRAPPLPPSSSAADGSRLIVGSATLSLWDAGSRTRLAKLSGHSNPVRSLCFEPSGRVCLSCAPGDRFVAAWDCDAAAEAGAGKEKKTARPASALLALGESAPLQLAAVSADGGFAVAAVSEQGIAYVWLCDEAAQPVASRVVRVRPPSCGPAAGRPPAHTTASIAALTTLALNSLAPQPVSAAL